MFSTQDIVQLEARGSSLDQVKSQIQYFVEGFPFLPLRKAATIGDGILRLSDEQLDEMIRTLDETVDASHDFTILKFVPASGAATRMFKSLFTFLESGKSDASVEEFFDRLSEFAFYIELQHVMGNDGLDIKTAERRIIAEYFLTDKGLGYGMLPKGLLSFHRYGNQSRTSLEEHLVEGAVYANSGGRVHLHFTVSPEHRDKFEKLVVEVLPAYEQRYGVKYFVSFSEQNPATDTIAVNMDDTPFREKDESLLFRPAGHGALLLNLHELDADLIFIKNIDNVVPDRIKDVTIIYKKALAGVLLQIQKRIFAYQERLEKGATPALLEEVAHFLESEVCVRPPDGFSDWGSEQKVAYFLQKLDRPLRVCGMVKNEGEPGGGPFWADNSDGSSSLQIVESAQVDTEDADQMGIFKNATHFNPVDLVCAKKNRKGEAYDLMRFRDPQTGFISYKSKDGKDLKAQELPGLWNGSMADWNTVFVEVPLLTFNPVKTVNDLLREQHQ